MEHSVEYTLSDGTEYRLTWDTESGEQMHYLLHEGGVLKMECWHHAIPDQTDEALRSVTVPAAFFTCVARHFQAKEMRLLAEASEDPRTRAVAPLWTGHISLSAEYEAYLTTVMERGHDAELIVHILQDLEVEQFAAQMNAFSAPVTVEDEPLDRWTKVKAALWALAVVGTVAGAIYLQHLIGR